LLSGALVLATSWTPWIPRFADPGTIRARNFRQHPIIAGVLDDAALVLLDLRIDRLTEMRLEPFVRPFLVGAHQTRIVGHIGGEDRGETAGRGHDDSPPFFEAFGGEPLVTIIHDIECLKRRPKRSTFWSV
jgi:hypothetical protein